MRSVAMVVGVGEYDSAEVPDLPVTALDARALAETLRDPASCGYPAEQVLTLIGPQATLANLRDGLRELRTRATRDATCVVYFSGHGGRMETPTGWRAYLCPCGTDPRRLDETALSAEEFTAALAAIPAGRLVVILDACFASATAELKAVGHGDQWKGGWDEQQYEALARGSGRVMIASSKAGQPSYARQQDGKSLFTKHLIAALQGQAAVRGDGLVHVLDVFHYVSDAVRQDEPRQEPILKAQNLDANFAIALAPAYASVPARGDQPIESVRQAIVSDPLVGAAELSALLKERPDAAALRDRVDERLSELKRLWREIAQAPREADLMARNDIVFFLLHVCSDLAVGVLTPIPIPIPVRGAGATTHGARRYLHPEGAWRSQCQRASPGKRHLQPWPTRRRADRWRRFIRRALGRGRCRCCGNCHTASHAEGDLCDGRRAETARWWPASGTAEAP